MTTRHHITGGGPCWCKSTIIAVPPNVLADALGLAAEQLADFGRAMKAFSERRPAPIHNGGKPRRKK